MSDIDVDEILGDMFSLKQPSPLDAAVVAVDDTVSDSLMEIIEAAEEEEEEEEVATAALSPTAANREATTTTSGGDGSSLVAVVEQTPAPVADSLLPLDCGVSKVPPPIDGMIYSPTL